MIQQFVRLGDVAEFIRGITFGPNDVNAEFAPNKIGVMRTKNVQDLLDLSDLWQIDSSFVKNPKQYLREGDLLVSSANSWNLVGKAVWIPNLEFRSTFGGFVTVLRGDEKKVCRKFLFHWFTSEHTQKMLRSFGNKTTNISNLNLKRALDLRLPLPPLAEQQRIAEQLDTADRILRLREQAIEKLDQLAQSVFMEMIGDLLAEHGHWQRIKLGDLKVSKRGSIDPAKHPSEIFTLYSIPAYDMKKQEVLPGSSIGSTKLFVQNGDVLLSKIVPHIRRAWVVGDEYKNRQIASGEWIVFSSDRIMPKVLRYLLISDTFHKRFMTTVAGVGGSLVRAQPRLVSEFEISLPPLELQQRFDAFENEFQAKRTVLERSRMDLLRLNASIRNRAFSAN